MTTSRLYMGAMIVVATGAGCGIHTARQDWSGYDGPGAEHFQRPEYRLPLDADPLEPFNRVMWGVNDVLVTGVLDPAGKLWRYVVPQPARSALVRAGRNLGAPGRVANHLLQWNLDHAGSETLRFLANTTAGVAGLFDPASEWGLPAAPTSTGETLVRWGWIHSTYLTLPMLGPSTTRDAVGSVVDSFLDPTSYFFPAGPINGFIQGSESVEGVMRFMHTQPDSYQAARTLWGARRALLPVDFAPADPAAATDSAVETLESVRVRCRDPWFPAQGRTRSALVPSTGRRLVYDAWIHREPAPLVCLVPGFGGHRRMDLSLAMAELAFDAGLSVVSISSVMHPEFMEAALPVAVPGLVPEDARAVHAALDAIVNDVDRRHPGRRSRTVLLGLSLGGVHALNIAANGDSDWIAFDHVVAVAPPVRLRYASEQIDAAFNVPLGYPAELRDDRVIAGLKKALDKVAFAGGSTPKSAMFTADEARFLIGLTFRLALHDVIWSSQQRHDLGILKTPRHALRRTPATREILDYSFGEYSYAFVLRSVAPDADAAAAERLFDRADLTAIGHGLAAAAAAGRIDVLTSRNDFLVAPEDVSWLTTTLGADHVILVERGGHLGHLGDPHVQARLAELLCR